VDILGVGLKRVTFFPPDSVSLLTSMLLRTVRFLSAVISTSKVALTAGSSCCQLGPRSRDTQQGKERRASVGSTSQFTFERL
jgi:hypothetical protein